MTECGSIEMLVVLAERGFTDKMALIRETVIGNDSGWRLLPLYQINPKSGQFVHRSFVSERFDTLRSLLELQSGDGVCRYSVPCQEIGAPNHEQVLAEKRASSTIKKSPPGYPRDRLRAAAMPMMITPLQPPPR